MGSAFTNPQEEEKGNDAHVPNCLLLCVSFEVTDIPDVMDCSHLPASPSLPVPVDPVIDVLLVDVGLEASIVLQLGMSGWVFCPVESHSNGSQHDLHCLALDVSMISAKCSHLS